MSQRERHSPYNNYVRSLRRAAEDWFRSRGAAVSPHIGYCLDKWADWPANIIVPDVVQLIKTPRESCTPPPQKLKLHRYIHHGLSSQALLFNLVGPLVVARDLDPLRDAFRESGVPWPGGDVKPLFEYSDRSVFDETDGQPTSLDLLLRGTNGAPVCVECKFVEPGFGGCSVFEWGDCDGVNPTRDPSLCYLDRLGRTYLTLLRDHGLAAGPIMDDSLCPLATNYQFFRELLFALDCGGDLVLLCDSRSPVFSSEDSSGRSRGRLRYLESIVPAQVWSRVHEVHIQDVVAAIEKCGRHPWVAEFRSKYAM